MIKYLQKIVFSVAFLFSGSLLGVLSSAEIKKLEVNFAHQLLTRAALGRSAIDVDSLKKVFRNLSLSEHPDKNQGDPDAVQKFQALNEAFKFFEEHINKIAHHGLQGILAVLADADSLDIALQNLAPESVVDD